MPAFALPIIGTAGNDVLTGTDADDYIEGRDGNDSIEGRSGKDDIRGMNGSDILNGGGGNDILSDGLGSIGLPLWADTLKGGPGDDILIFKELSDGDYADGGDGEDTLDIDLHLTLGVSFSIDPSTNQISFFGADVTAINFERFAVTAYDVKLSLGSNADTAHVFYGRNNVRGRGGDDALYGGDGHDVLKGGDGDDSIVPGDGRDTVLGGAGDDIITVVKGSAGETIDGGAGRDTLIITQLSRTAIMLVASHTEGQGTFNGTEFFGIERIQAIGTAENDSLSGGNGADRLEGWVGDDVVNGNGGHDRITTQYGNDVLNGGAGDDILTDKGWNGNHTEFVFEGDFGHDTVRGFTVGNDIITLRGYTAEDVTITQTSAKTWTLAADNGLTSGSAEITAIGTFDISSLVFVPL